MTHKIGQKLPDARLGTMGGKSVAFSDYEGRPRVVYIWASWDPSRERLGELEAFHKKHPELTVISVACDAQGVDLPMRYVARAKCTHETWMDATCVLARRWKVKKAGVVLFLNEAGCVLFQGEASDKSLFKTLEGVAREKAKLKPIPAFKVDTHDTKVEFLTQQCLNYLTRRRVDDAVGFLRQAAELDPENDLIPPQTWALRHPEKFYEAAVDVAWLKKQPRLAP